MRPALEHICGKQTSSASILFSNRISYLFHTSKCRGESNLVLCTCLVITKRMSLRAGDRNIRLKNVFSRKICRNLPMCRDMLERWPHVCRVKITFTLLLTNCVVFTATNLMKCLVNCIPLRIHVGSTNTQPHLKEKHRPKRGGVNCKSRD